MSYSRSPSSARSDSRSTRASPRQTNAFFNGAQFKQLCDLKLELELRDQRIVELEKLFDEGEQKAAYTEGLLHSRLAESDREASTLKQRQQELQSVISKQSGEIDSLRKEVLRLETIEKDMSFVLKRLEEIRSVPAPSQAEAETKRQLEEVPSIPAPIQAEAETKESLAAKRKAATATRVPASGSAKKKSCCMF